MWPSVGSWLDNPPLSIVSISSFLNICVFNPIYHSQAPTVILLSHFQRLCVFCSQWILLRDLEFSCESVWFGRFPTETFATSAWSCPPRILPSSRPNPSSRRSSRKCRHRQNCRRPLESFPTIVLRLGDAFFLFTFGIFFFSISSSLSSIIRLNTRLMERRRVIPLSTQAMTSAWFSSPESFSRRPESRTRRRSHFSWKRTTLNTRRTQLCLGSLFSKA